MPSVPPACELHLFPCAEVAWTQVIRPWLATRPEKLARRFVVVPTRGQSHGLKQRCLVEGVPLLGVEFITPALARRKWLALARPPRPALDRRLELVGLRAIIHRRRQTVGAGSLPSEDAGLLRSLQSDAERALRCFDELVGAGFGPQDFEQPLLRDVFEELSAWVRATGYDRAEEQTQQAALAPAPPEAPRAGDALLIYGLSAEDWGAFFPVAAFARRCGAVTVVLPEPALRGRGLDEGWVTLWEDFLGVEATLHADEEGRDSCALIGQVLTGEAPPPAALDCEVIVGRTQGDEMNLVARKIESLLATGAEDIAVVFPGADAGHRRLAALLAARGIPFCDLLETPGTPPIEVRVQRALIDFYRVGGRLEEFLDLWALLRALGWVEVPSGAARTVCEQLFDETQSHLLAAGRERLAASEHPDWRAVHKLAERLLPPWPAELTLADALGRFHAIAEAFLLPVPAGWDELASFAARETGPLPLALAAEALAAFLPNASPAAVAGKGVFARVTLTTRRRAGGEPWSHVIFTGATVGTWPAAPELGPWLTEEHRVRLNARARFSLGLLTRDDRAQLERDAYAAITRDTREEIIFSAALFDEQEPELKRGPNAWVERLLFWQNAVRPDWSLERAWEAMAQVAPRAPEESMPTGEREQWRSVWISRRDPVRPFDEYFYCADPAVARPAYLAAGLIERGFQDPAVLWYESVLGVRAVDWRPFVRASRRALGKIVHRVLAEALRGEEAGTAFHPMLAPAECRARLEQALAAWRRGRPVNCYWESFHAELAHVARVLLEKLLALPGGRFAAVEWTLPRGVALPAGRDRIGVRGRIDVALADQPRWEGSVVNIVDFKTGTIPPLSGERMAKKGDGLQLGVYLAAARELGATAGRVWLLKPEPGGESSLTMEEVTAVLAPLARLGDHLASGRYGQLTADRTEYSRGFEPPLACTPIKHAVLAEKFRRTFGAAQAAGEDDDE
jgi:hypothetical protein